MMSWQTITCLSLESRKSDEGENPLMRSITELSLSNEPKHDGKECSTQAKEKYTQRVKDETWETWAKWKGKCLSQRCESVGLFQQWQTLAKKLGYVKIQLHQGQYEHNCFISSFQ